MMTMTECTHELTSSAMALRMRTQNSRFSASAASSRQVRAAALLVLRVLSRITPESLPDSSPWRGVVGRR